MSTNSQLVVTNNATTKPRCPISTNYLMFNTSYIQQRSVAHSTLWKMGTNRCFIQIKVFNIFQQIFFSQKQTQYLLYVYMSVLKSSKVLPLVLWYNFYYVLSSKSNSFVQIEITGIFNEKYLKRSVASMVFSTSKFCKVFFLVFSISFNNYFLIKHDQDDPLDASMITKFFEKCVRNEIQM